MEGDAEQLPAWVTWQRRPFPDANLLLLGGRQPALVDSGFVGHAQDTAAWARAQAEQVALVVNTHWHADHVGANGLLQAGGAGIAASAPDAQAVARRDPGCCQAEYLDQPVSPYTIDEPLHDGQILGLGDADWQVLRTPGHTPGHLSLWQPEARLLVMGDVLLDYDVGWVNLALDGPEVAATALASLHRLADLAPRVLLPAHGPLPADPAAAFAAALGRAQRLVDDPAGAVWYGARRIFAFALMIRDGIPTDEVEPYLHAPGLADRRGPAVRQDARGTGGRTGRHDASQRRHRPSRRAAARGRRAPRSRPLRCGRRSPGPGRKRHRQQRELPSRINALANCGRCLRRVR